MEKERESFAYFVSEYSYYYKYLFVYVPHITWFKQSETIDQIGIRVSEF